MNMPWLRHYPPGTPASIELPESLSLVSMLARSCGRFAQRPAFHHWGTTLSFAELDRQSASFANYLHAQGLRKGDRLALMMPNLLQYPIAMFGALRAGLVVVNTNPLYSPRELEHQLADSGASGIVVLANFAHVLEQVLEKLPLRLIIVTQLGDLLAFPKGLAVSWLARKVKKLVPHYQLAQAVTFAEALEAGARSPRCEVPIGGSDLAFLQYTGGTTGVAKGAGLTHRNMVANLEQVSALWRDDIVDGEESIITALPLYHIFCLTCNCLTFVKHGGLNVLITDPRDMKRFIRELEHWRFSFISGVNTLYAGLLDQPGFASLDFSRLKLGVSGGMPLQPTVAERWRRVTRRPLIEGYGLTEASPVVACNLPNDARQGTVGVPLPWTEISIRDEAEREIRDEAGELWVRGPQVMQGYWHNAKETADTLRADGWLRTGDIATLDEDGYLRIVDRKKDMIIVSGFKVFPNEVEDVVSMLAGVCEVGCIGVPDEATGQAVKVYVVLREPSGLTVEQILVHCRQSLTAYKIPKHVEFRATLPKTNVGKILRRALLEDHLRARAAVEHNAAETAG